MRIILLLCAVATVAAAQTPELDSSFIPQNLHIGSSSLQSVTVEWNRVDSATGYRVWYGFSPDNLDYGGDTPFLEFEKAHLQEGGKYYFAVSAVNDTKESLRSPTILCQLPSTPPPWKSTAAANRTDSASVPAPTVAHDTMMHPKTMSAIDTLPKTASETPAPTKDAHTTVLNSSGDSDESAKMNEKLFPAQPPATPAAAPSPGNADDSLNAFSHALEKNKGTQPQKDEMADNNVDNNSDKDDSNELPDSTPRPPVENQQSTPPSSTPTAPATPTTPAAPEEPTTPTPPPAPIQNNARETNPPAFSHHGISQSERDCFTVQVEASLNRQLEEQHLAALQKRGVEARIELFEINGTSWYRLRAGKLKSKEDAERMLHALAWTHKTFRAAGPAVFYNDHMVK